MGNITLGDLQGWLVILATTITSIGVIVGAVYKLFKYLLKKALEPFNDRIDETIANNNKRFDELIKKIDNNDIDVVRGRIVAFEQICRLDVNYNNIKQHQYKTYFKDEDKWAMYHKIYPELNGEINTAIESINEHYKHAKF